MSDFKYGNSVEVKISDKWVKGIYIGRNPDRNSTSEHIVYFYDAETEYVDMYRVCRFPPIYVKISKEEVIDIISKKLGIDSELLIIEQTQFSANLIN